MSRTTKAVLPVARRALTTGQRILAPYAHRFAPKKFTQPQLFAVLVVRQMLRLDYRGMEARLREWAELRDALGLTAVPSYSTLCYAHQRLLSKKACRRHLTPRSAAPPATAG